MKNSQFIKTIMRMQYVPRWDEYAPRFSDNAASHSYRCASFALLAALKEKELGNEINEFKVVGRALFHDLNETITGSIKRSTKKDPDVREYIKILEKEAAEEIVSYLTPSLSEEIYDFVVNAEDDSYEGLLVDGIDTFDAMVFCYRETQFGSNPFFLAQFTELEEQLRNHKIPSVRWLVEEFRKKEGLYEFLMNILRMDTIRRWKGNQNLIHDDDAIHTFRATSLSLFSGIYETKETYKEEINLFSLIGRTLFHDLVESITGDILGPVKHATPETKRAFAIYEKKVANRMVSSLPEWMKDEMHTFVVEAKSESYEGYLVGASDKIDALIKSKQEKEINTKEYEETYYAILNNVKKTYDNESVEFFLEYILNSI